MLMTGIMDDSESLIAPRVVSKVTIPWMEWLVKYTLQVISSWLDYGAGRMLLFMPGATTIVERYITS